MGSTKASKRKEEQATVNQYLIELAEEQQEVEAGRRAKAISMASAREAYFLSQFKEVSDKIFKNSIQPSKYALKPHTKVQHRILNVVLSDLHFHSLLDPREVPLRYGPTEEARRLSAIALQTVEYKRQYRDETTLFVHLLGDIIQGQLHDLRDGAPLAEQCGAAIYLLSQTLSFFSANFPKVVVRCTPGNHGRNKARHFGRAIHQKWDAIETIVYYALKVAAESLPNVKVDLGYTPYYIADAFNQRGFYTHGDSVISPGNPGKAIDIASIEKQANRLNAAEAHRGNKGLDVIVVGHVHTGSMTVLPNGTVFISNGALVPSDPFCVSMGLLETACGQWLYESVEDHIVGDSRFMMVDEYSDKDTTLDKIIKPFSGF